MPRELDPGWDLDLRGTLETWWDGAWEAGWNRLDEALRSSSPMDRAHAAFAQPEDGASGSKASDSKASGSKASESSAAGSDAGTQDQGLSEEELRSLTLTDAAGFPGEDADEEDADGTGKATPLPETPGFKAGASPFRPPKELIQLMAGKATLDGAPLIPGWNLLSTPEEPADAEPAAVLSPIAGAYTRAYAYDNCDTVDPWKVYDPNDPANSDLSAIDHRIGFWLEATSAVELPFDGTLPATTEIPICPGWNLVGYPAGQSRHVTNALHTIEGKYLRVFGYDATDADDPWEVYSVGVPEWGNDLTLMHPGRGYWVLATEAATLTIANQGPDPIVDITSPADLDVVTDFTDVVGTVDSPILDSWTLTYERIGETEPVELASGVAPVTGGVLATFDPTLLVNGLYELKLEATDLEGRVVEDSIAVSVEGNMKIGHFTLTFIDLAIPLSGLDIEILRTYDSRRKDELLDFGHGWSLDIRQGSYQNNRPPGDGWQIVNPGGPFGLPCTQTLETKSHLTTVRLSDQEIYRFRLKLTDTATLIGGCQARAYFEWVDGPQPGSTLEILGNDYVIYENASDRLLDQDSFQVFEPGDVRLTTRDGRIFHLDLETGVTHLEDQAGNSVEISVDGITHSSGVGIDFLRDAQGQIQEIVDLRGNSNLYGYDLAGDLVRHTDRAGSDTSFTYREHYLEDVHNALGVRAARNEYDEDGRLSKVIDANGNAVSFEHDLDARREVVGDRLGFTRILEYDERGNIVREIDQLGQPTQRTFDARDNVLSITDPLDRSTVFTYSPANLLTSKTDALGHTTTFVYGPDGLPSTIREPDGTEILASWDGESNLEQITNALGAVTSFDFASGNLTGITEPSGGVTTFGYNDRGDLLEETNPAGTTSYAYDANGNVVEERRSRTLGSGQTEVLVTSYTYDGVGRTLSVENPEGGVISTSYDDAGNLVSQTDELGRTTTLEYDALGRVTSYAFPDGTTERTAYDEEGRVVETVDRAGRSTTYTYDPVGRLLTTTYPDGATTSNAYDAAGQRIATTDAGGHTTQFAFDAVGRRVSTTDPLGNETTFTFGPNPNRRSADYLPATMTDPLGNVTTFTYDGNQQLVTVEHPDGTTTGYTYDLAGRRTSHTDPSGRTTRFEYDTAHRLVRVVDALEHATQYTYDEVGNRTSATDARGHVTAFGFDSLGNQISRTLPGGLQETWTYGADSRPTTHTDFNGETTTFQYDAAGRLTSRSYADGTSVGFTYGPTGQVSTVTDSRGVTSFSYDARDRMVEKADPTGHALIYAYDLEGHRISLESRVGTSSRTVSYAYDAADRLTSVTDSRLGRASMTYDANGNRTALSLPNGTSTAYDHDSMDRLVRSVTEGPGGDVVQSLDYTLGPAGHRLGVVEADGSSREYTYDALHRLTGDRRLDPAGELLAEWSFDYDEVGNRIAETITDSAGTTTTFSSTYDDKNRLLQSGDTTFQYDANGNLTAKQEPGGVTTYGWNAAQRLARVELADGSSVTSDYDAQENRVRTVTQTAGGDTSTVEYLVDTSGPLSQVVAELTGGQVGTAYTLAGDEELALHRPAEEVERYFHTDAIGTVRTLTDEAGAVTDRYAFEAFGGLLEHQGDDPNPILFAGEHREPLTGLYSMRSRWLDTDAGRFLGMDPFHGVTTAPMTQHPYLYALADPVNHVDPSGRFAVGIGIGLGSIGTLSIGLFTAPAGGSKSPSRVLDCPHGREPTKLEVLGNSISFPRLASGEFRVTAPGTDDYNCIAWTIGVTSFWVWSSVDQVTGDNDGTVEISDFDAFYLKLRNLKRVRFFSRHRARVVLYSLDGEPKHAAVRHDCTSRKQLYESKLGRTERIIHKRAALKGPVYGYDLRYYAKID